jgi:hypothetical protein
MGVVVVAVLLGAPGCGQEDGAPAGAPQGPETVTVTSGQGGKAVTLRRGDTLVVALGEPGHWIVARHPDALSPRGEQGPSARHSFVATRPGAGRVVVVDLAGLERMCGAPGNDVDAACGPLGEEGGAGADDDLRPGSFTLHVTVVG